MDSYAQGRHCAQAHLGLQKHAWFGTYYHGTTPQAEQSILQEGLQARRGGTGGAISALEEALGKNPFSEKFRGESAGKVTLSRSKALAKLYGTGLSNKELLGRMFNRATGESGGALSPTAWRGHGRDLRNVLRAYVEHQPIQVQGRGLPLTRDPSHALTAVHSAQDIPLSRIQKAKPSVTGRVLRTLLRK